MFFEQILEVKSCHGFFGAGLVWGLLKVYIQK